MAQGEIGRSAAEIALTKHLAATLVQKEVIEPMSVNNWRHGSPPSPEQAAVIIAERARKDGATDEQIAEFLKERGVTYTPPASGQPAGTEGAPTPAPAPVAPVQSGQPAQTVSAPAPAAPVKTDVPADLAAAQNVLTLMESLRDASGKIMGKYDTLEQALKGAGHLANMAKAALQRAEQADARLTSAPAASVNAAPPVAAPAAAPVIKPFVPSSRPGLEAAQARLDKVLSRVSNDGFEGDSAREYAEATRELAREQALAVAAEAEERAKYARESESAKWDAVNTAMTEKYPDSVNVSDDEFNLFLRSNPLLVDAMAALRAQGRELRAAELGYTEFTKARNGVISATGGMTRAEAERKEADLAAREQVRKELRDEALKDAGIVHGSAGGASSVETPGITGPSQDDINAAAARMRREGDAPGSPSAMEWRRMTIGRFLPPELFGS